MPNYNNSDRNFHSSIDSEMDLSSLYIKDSIPKTIGDESNGSFSTIDTDRMTADEDSSFSSLEVEVAVPRTIRKSSKSLAGPTRKLERTTSLASSTHSRRTRRRHQSVDHLNLGSDKFDQVKPRARRERTSRSRKPRERKLSLDALNVERQQLRSSCKSLSLKW